MITATRQVAHRAKLRAVRIAVTTAGVAGSATGNASSPIICGQIVGVAVNWHASAPAGTSDIVVEGGTTGRDLYAKTNAVTDVYKCPGLYGLDAAAAALTGDVTPQRYCLNETVKVTVSQSDALTNCAIVTVTYRPVRAERVLVTTTGADGSGAGTGTSGRIRGEVLGIQLDFHASAPGTTDLTISVNGYNLYAKANSVTDTFVVPVLFGVDAANTALTNDVTPQHYCASGRVSVVLAGCNALDPALTAVIFWMPLDVVRIAVTTTGVAGSATGSSAVQVEGEIMGLAIICHASLPATADLTVEFTDNAIDLWARADSATSVFVAPRIFSLSNADGALAADVTPECYAVHDHVTASVAQGDALTNALIVDVFVRR